MKMVGSTTWLGLGPEALLTSSMSRMLHDDYL